MEMKESKESKSYIPPLPPSPRTSEINRKNCGIFSIRCDRHVHFGTVSSKIFFSKKTLAILLQKRARVFLAKQRMQRLREAKVAVLLQRHARRWLCKRRAHELRKERASTRIAAFFRGSRARAFARVVRKRFEAAVRSG